MPKTKPPKKNTNTTTNTLRFPYIPSPPFANIFTTNPTQPNQQKPCNHTFNNPSNHQPCDAQQPNAFARWVSSSIFPLASRNASWSEALAPKWAKKYRPFRGGTNTHTHTHTPWKKTLELQQKLGETANKTSGESSEIDYKLRYNERGRPLWNSNFDSYRIFWKTNKDSITSKYLVRFGVQGHLRGVVKSWQFRIFWKTWRISRAKDLGYRNSVTKIAQLMVQKYGETPVEVGSYSWKPIIYDVFFFTSQVFLWDFCTINNISHNIEFGSVTFKVIQAWLRNAFLFEVDLSAIFTMILAWFVETF